jgi:hypothetical protein
MAQLRFCSVCRFNRTHSKCLRCGKAVCHYDDTAHWQHFIACYPESKVLQNAAARIAGSDPPNDFSDPDARRGAVLMDIRAYYRRLCVEPKESGRPTRKDRSATKPRTPKAFPGRTEGN